jgi:hypothetical protein
MKLYVNEKHKRRSIIAHLFMPFVFMGIMSWGSYDPRNPGFWGSILFSIFVGVVGDYFLVKSKRNSNNSSAE